MLGWPEIPPETEFVDIPKPVKSDYTTDKIGPDNPTKSYKMFTELEAGYDPKDDTSFPLHLPSSNFYKMGNDFSGLLPSLKSGKPTKDEFISVVSAGNKIIDDMERLHTELIQAFTDEKFKLFNSSIGQIYRARRKERGPDHTLHSFFTPERLKNRLYNAIDEGFQAIYNAWETGKKRQLKFLTYNNDPDGGGKHIAPNNVDISQVITLNLVCDAVEGSYQINLTKSDQAQQGYILYSFAPSVSPGYLLIEDPVNPVYMRCHNKFLTSINFSLTDQANNLIDLRGEELVISLLVKS